jgi:hypothetical protein
MKYEGDIEITLNEFGSLDCVFENGQPIMTNGGLNTFVILAVFGVDNWQNAITDIDAEKYKSKFPEVINRAIVSDRTKNEGINALNEALEVLKKEKIAKVINITGQILNVFGIGWQIEIEKYDGEKVKYDLNWERQKLSLAEAS